MPSTKPCGTAAAYSRHRYQNTEPCDPCRAAWAEYMTALRRRQGTKPFKTAQCGTKSAFDQHYRNGEKPCEPCYEAKRRYEADLRRRKGVPEVQPAKCGTLSGHDKHKRNGQTPCFDCRDAYNWWQRDRYAGVPTNLRDNPTRTRDLIIDLLETRGPVRKDHLVDYVLERRTLKEQSIVRDLWRMREDGLIRNFERDGRSWWDV